VADGLGKEKEQSGQVQAPQNGFTATDFNLIATIMIDEPNQ